MRTIVVSGMDGAGKTTLIQRLAKQFTPLRTECIHLPSSSFVNSALATSGQGTPLGDPWTDRLIFALDNRLTAYQIRALEAAGATDVLLMQRGWMDSYIYGSTQRVDYGTITNLVRPTDLPKPTCSIYLNCDPTIAYERIRNSKKVDKFETLAFMQAQYRETKRFYESLEHDAILGKIFDEPRFYLDTTALSTDEVELSVIDFLKVKCHL